MTSLPPQVVLVPVVHQALGANDGGQPGGEEAIVSVNDRQPLILKLGHRKLALKY